MKTRSHKRATFLTFTVLLGLPCVLCFMWVRKEQQQYALNRALIEALSNDNTKRALALVEAGADPNTRYSPTPALYWTELMNQLLHRSPLPANDSPAALMIVCGSYMVNYEGECSIVKTSNAINPQLVQVMLVHRANVNAKDMFDWSALQWAIAKPRSIIIIKQLLDYGADANISVKVTAEAQQLTPIELAEANHRPDIVALLRHYRKHP